MMKRTNYILKKQSFPLIITYRRFKKQIKPNAAIIINKYLGRKCEDINGIYRREIPWSYRLA